MTRVLIVDDERSVRFTLRELVEDLGHEVIDAESGEAALRVLDDVDLVITDLSMPGMDGLALLARIRAIDPRLAVVMLTARGSERIAVRAMKEGALDYLTKPFDVEEMTLVIERALEHRALRRKASRLELEHALGRPLLGEAPAFERVLAAAVRVAGRDVPVLVRGETGTGKELLASVLHVAGTRASGPLVRFNCAAIPAELADAELFGHAKGAFTGATAARRGWFAEAHGGTLVLDEIGELPLAIQAKLLRAVQEGEIQPVGAARVEKVDVRIVACTHRDLKSEAAAGRFREDLYYRLAVVELTMPPLRERRGDIPQLARTFAARYAERFALPDVALAPALIDALAARAWPGNVRELENTIARCVALSEGGVIGLDALDDTTTPTAHEGTFRAQVEAFERELITRALAEHGGNQSEAARRLGMPRVTLVDRIKRYGIG
ncbi:sigma-54-dependent transcriptional regulator [Sandaracinus amylolyticus]|uniref:sigma-54-dependent transcriptional regulator n=1 Tax=Sandaracinus amylolyticus TaxID=927083 RepID=UPI001F32BDF8|nr:sigma-54 dependent transcriptional regulator [Sandaracinus amylolyticus]UJR78243.1 Acetoacetate metabolism regulatory protein AtoC [Sandaracinus amylolyticus]